MSPYTNFSGSFRSLPVFLSCRWVLVLAPLVLLASCGESVRVRSDDLVQVEVRGVGFDPAANSPVVILQDAAHTKAIPIWVGMAEAQAIHLQLQGTVTPRPMTHDLLKNILERVGVGFEKVVVTEMKDNTYYAFIYLANGKSPIQIDSRPSDAIALALRFHRPIFVASRLFDTAVPHETQPAKLQPTQAVHRATFSYDR